MQIITINPSNLSLPEDLAFVFLQPYLTLETVGQRHVITKREIVLDKIKRTCDLGLNFRCSSNPSITNASFIVFPEYSVTFPEGYSYIENAVKSSSAKNLIVIGGLEGIKLEDYKSMEEYEIFKGKKISSTGFTNAWLNTAFILLKDEQGNTSLYLQPKLCASPTLERDMVKGEFIYLWDIHREKRNFKFLISICYEMIEQVGGTLSLLENYNEAIPSSNTVQLDMIINIQRNEQLNDTFKKSYQDVFDISKFSRINREDMAILLVNNAGKDSPGKCIDSDLGNSAIIFQGGNKLHPYHDPKDGRFDVETITLHPPKKDTTRQYFAHDVLSVMVFREKGDSTHSFVYKPFLNRQTGYPARIEPKNTRVFNVSDVSDNRNKGENVPSYTKWFLDELDILESINFPILKRQLSDFSSARKELINYFRYLPAQYKYFEIMKYSCGFNKEFKENADFWDEDGLMKTPSALKHYYRCLMVFKIALNSNFKMDNIEGVSHLKLENRHYYFITSMNGADAATHLHKLIQEKIGAHPQMIFEGREEIVKVISIVKNQEDDTARIDGSMDYVGNIKNLTVRQISQATFFDIARDADETTFLNELFQKETP